MTRVCRVRDGAINWGPGLLTMVEGDLSSDWFDLPKMLPQDREAAGFFEIEDRGKRDFDDRFEIQEITGLILDNGRPVEMYVYNYIPAWETVFINMIDIAAEEARARVATSLPLQTMEYAQANKEALDLQDKIDNDELWAESDYPFLMADIGATVYPETGATVATVEEAASVVLEQASQFKTFGPQIRNQRLVAKSAVRQAKSDNSPATAKTAYETFITNIG